MTGKECKALLLTMIRAYPSCDFTPEQVKIYEKLLCDIDFDLAKAAVVHLIATSKWLPTVAEIRAAAFKLSEGPVRSGEEAWGDVIEAISRYGYYRRPYFEDPTVAYCVERLSWRALCLSENAIADRARFCELYDHKARQHREEMLSEAIPAVQEYRRLQGEAQKNAARTFEMAKEASVLEGPDREDGEKFLSMAEVTKMASEAMKPKLEPIPVERKTERPRALARFLDNHRDVAVSDDQCRVLSKAFADKNDDEIEDMLRKVFKK